MNRNLISLASLLLVAFSFTVGSTDAEARCGIRRNRCCQSNGYQQGGYQNGYNGYGRSRGACCGQGNGYQQAGNWGCQQSRVMTTACCNPQSGGYTTQPARNVTFGVDGARSGRSVPSTCTESAHVSAYVVASNAPVASVSLL